MRVGPKGLSLIKDFEGLELEAYQDIVGIWTIGYGHTDAAGPPEVTPGLTITEAEAEDILRSDLGQYEDAVNAMLRPLIDDGFVNVNQFSGIVSLVFNVGVGNFQRSKAFTALLDRDLDTFRREAFDEDVGFVFAGGVQVPGLQRRRAAERALFDTPVEPTVPEALLAKACPQDQKNSIRTQRTKPRRAGLGKIPLFGRIFGRRHRRRRDV